MIEKASLPVSRHFTLQTLADGVHAVVATWGGAAECNAGIVDLGGMRLVFDAFFTPSAAKDLQHAAVQLTGAEPDFLINSHYHNDHIWGNQVFSTQTHLVSTQRTRELILTEGKEELEEATADAARTLEHFRQQLQDARDDRQRVEAELFFGSYTELVKDLPRLKVRLPDVLFTGRLAFQGSARRAELITFKDCHTADDSVLFLPEDGVVFMGDLLFTGCHPYLGECDPRSLAAALREIKTWQADTFVPGHGAVGPVKDLDLMIEYIECCEEAARELHRQGKTDAEAVKAVPVSEKFKDWYISSFFPGNLRAMLRKLGA